MTLLPRKPATSPNMIHEITDIIAPWLAPGRAGPPRVRPRNGGAAHLLLSDTGISTQPPLNHDKLRAGWFELRNADAIGALGATSAAVQHDGRVGARDGDVQTLLQGIEKCRFIADSKYAIDMPRR
jgi:hypothetical protein